MGSDIFPELYTPQQMRDGILGSVALGNAPATPGTYQATVFAGAGGYVNVGNKTIDFIVAAPVLSVSIYFSYLKEKAKAFML